MKQEPKQETLEEAAEKTYKKLYKGEPLTQDVPINAFIKGAKWQQERMYSEEDIKIAFNANIKEWISFEEFIEQFKNK